MERWSAAASLVVCGSRERLGCWMIGTEDGRSFRSSENPATVNLPWRCAARLFQRSVTDAKFAPKTNKIRLLAIVPADTIPH
jgi:hypothetical protein